MPFKAKPIQTTFPRFSLVEDAVAKMAVAGVEDRGAIFTRREVVNFILDLVGYTSDKPLHFGELIGATLVEEADTNENGLCALTE